MNFDDVKGAMSGSNSKSPGTRFGLKFDPLAYIFGKKYRDLINKSGDTLNKTLAPIQKSVNKVDRKINPVHKAIDKTAIGGKVKQWVENKPGSTMGLVYGGGAAYGGLSGAGGGAASGADLGVFSNGGTAGMGSVGGGNAGALASSGGIEGGAGIGSASTSSTAPAWQDLAKQGMNMGGGQQQQAAPQPYEGRAAQLERERQKREADELAKRQQLAAAMRAQGMYTPA
jgi:hypothetical protein